VHFEIVHEFDISLDAIELAVLSPGLVDKLAARLHNIEKVEQKTHELEGGRLARVWSYQANIKIPGFAKNYVTREMCAWDEVSTYNLKTHSSEWTIDPHVKPEWKKYFTAHGRYELVPMSDGRTRRVVRGDLELKVPVVQKVAERMIVNEVKKTFEAEAETLRDLATLV
jgi:Protein of unknown function (DUF2505)